MSPSRRIATQAILAGCLKQGRRERPRDRSLRDFFQVSLARPQQVQGAVDEEPKNADSKSADHAQADERSVTL